MPNNRNVTLAFTAEQVSRLSGISVGRLRYWEKTDAFTPEKAEVVISGAFSRFYSFQDLVNLRVIAQLRRDLNIELNQLRSVSAYLQKYPDVPWSSLAVRVSGRRLEFRDPESKTWLSASPLGQSVLEIEFETVRLEAEQAARSAMQRRADQHGKIVRNRNVMSNQFVFDGTRIPVSTVLRLIEAGYSESDIRRSYPTLAPSDITAAREFNPAEPVVA